MRFVEFGSGLFTIRGYAFDTHTTYRMSRRRSWSELVDEVMRRMGL